MCVTQVVDDILDVTATTEKLGKTAGKDLLSDKTTYPSLLGLDKSREVGQIMSPWQCITLHSAIVSSVDLRPAKV